MLQILNKKFAIIGSVKFLKTGAILALVADILNAIYITRFFLPSYLRPEALTFAILQKTGVRPSHDELFEIQKLMEQTVASILFIFLIIHAFIYFKFGRDRNWAKRYTHGYALFGIILTLLMLPEMLDLGHYLWSFTMFMTTIAYLYILLGINYFKKTVAQ